ncbi:MAG: DNA-directed RNA polymerase subunit L [Patescibacteria group bacterium]|jgi:DNA-directed RNA polymerase subunit L
MEIKVLLDEKKVLEVEVDNVTIAEVVRMYLNDGGASLAVWHRSHPNEKPIIRVEGDNPKKLMATAIDAVVNDIDSTVESFKKLK